MKVVLAFDKFKGSATASDLNESAHLALHDCDGLNVTCVPVADGGDGTTEVLASACKGVRVTIPTVPPLINLPPVEASYFLCDDGTALIEVAAASGMSLVPDELRDIFRLNTFGTGLLIRDAMERGSRHIVLGLGGSATCDAAMGIMCALGAEFFNAEGRLLFPCGGNLQEIDHIGTEGIPHEVLESRFTLLADVDNPLCGELGTAKIFGPQKGADPEQVRQLECGMCRIADIIGEEIATAPGCGAAGGIPSLMLHLLNCELLEGAPYVLARNGLSEVLTGADLVITGEGQLDRQTMMGKGPGCVAKMAQQRGVPVAAVCGKIAQGFDPREAGFYAAVAVSEGLPEAEAMAPDGTRSRVAAAVRDIVTHFQS
jgi:glycerate kinase